MGLWKNLFGGNRRVAGELSKNERTMTIPQFGEALSLLMKTGLDSAKVVPGLEVVCPKCGPYTRDAKTWLVIVALGGLSHGKSHFFVDPKMGAAASAFAAGKCPDCGSTSFKVRYEADPRERYREAFYRLPQQRRDELEAEFKRVSIEFGAVYGLTSAFGGNAVNDPDEYLANMIDFVSARMPSRPALSEDEFFGLATRWLENLSEGSKTSGQK